jgi:pimeloyl-ACP methyl ester carboxylesterase
MSEGWTDNDGVRIHYLERGPGRAPGAAVPVLVVPGMGESAHEYEWLLDALGDRHVVIVDVRGRGPSDAPDHGYRWEDHYRDVAAAVAATGIDRPALVGFSRGSSYALGYALAHPGVARGVVMGDYFARHVGLPEAALPFQLEQVIRGVPMTERMPEHAVRAVQAESVEVPLWDRLPELGCPLLVIKGGRRSSIMNDEQLDKYREALPSVEIVLMPDAGHDLWSRDPDAYLAVLRPFLDRLDR